MQEVCRSAESRKSGVDASREVGVGTGPGCGGLGAREREDATLTSRSAHGPRWCRVLRRVADNRSDRVLSMRKARVAS